MGVVSLGFAVDWNAVARVEPQPRTCRKWYLVDLEFDQPHADIAAALQRKILLRRIHGDKVWAIVNRLLVIVVFRIKMK